MHELLARQLTKAFGSREVPAELAGFVGAVNAAYEQADRDRAMLERSMELASQELIERNRQLEQDIEARKRLEIELQHSAKLTAVGQLAAGIAHEINTPIQYVGDNLSFLKIAFGELSNVAAELLARGASYPEIAKKRADLQYFCEQIPSALEASKEGCRRVAEIVRAMRLFAHPGGKISTTADINLALTSTLAVARNVIKYVAEVELELGELPLVACRIGDINQVFLNLIVNAAHAVSDKFQATGELGVIRVVSRVDRDRVVVEVADNGAGIPPDIQPRIFEPFFTTKGVGRGTGQGLAMSRAIIVEQHRGSLNFRSTPGEGTTFVVELPISSKTSLPTEAIVGAPGDA